jgi:hypothetical protein
MHNCVFTLSELYIDGEATHDCLTDTAFIMSLQDLVNSFTYVGSHSGGYEEFYLLGYNTM